MSDKLPQERRWRGWREGMLPERRVVERCAYCRFSVAAPPEEARAAFRAHVCAGEGVPVGSECVDREFGGRRSP